MVLSMTTKCYVTAVAAEAEIKRLTGVLIYLDERGRWATDYAEKCRSEVDRLRGQLGKPVLGWMA